MTNYLLETFITKSIFENKNGQTELKLSIYRLYHGNIEYTVQLRIYESFIFFLFLCPKLVNNLTLF